MKRLIAILLSAVMVVSFASVLTFSTAAFDFKGQLLSASDSGLYPALRKSSKKLATQRNWAYRRISRTENTACRITSRMISNLRFSRF